MSKKENNENENKVQEMFYDPDFQEVFGKSPVTPSPEKPESFEPVIFSKGFSRADIAELKAAKLPLRFASVVDEEEIDEEVEGFKHSVSLDQLIINEQHIDHLQGLVKLQSNTISELEQKLRDYEKN